MTLTLSRNNTCKVGMHKKAQFLSETTHIDPNWAKN